VIHRQQGFTMVELLVAIVLVAVGILSTVGVLASAHKLSAVAERQTSLAHRAQRELERLQSLSYGKLAMTAAPAHSTDPANPDFYALAGGTFQYDRDDASKTESFAVDSAGAIGTAGQPWTDGRLSGSIYDFVTWTTDPKCGPGCPTSNDYKRITVVVTLTGATHPSKPALVSTVVADPNAAPTGAPQDSVQNPLDSPSTTCQVGTNGDGSPILGACSNGIDGTPITNYLYDTKTLDTSNGGDVITRQPITGDHTTHQTIAPVKNVLGQVVCSLLGLLLSNCQNPNLMGSTPPPAPTPLPPVYKYSTNVTGDVYTGGQVLHQDVSCSSTPSWTGTDQNKGDFWTTPALSSSTTLNGSGGATLYMQSATGVAVNATICLGIYAAPQSILGLLNTPPVQLGVLALANVNVPTVPTPVSFNFTGAFGTSGGQANTYTFVAGKRIGIRVWIAASAGDVALLYDHPQFASVVQVNAQ
jgi:prepilin-type N-terminal cleavage/methylation domain-containing protein